MEKLLNYIGITGCTTVEQARALLDAFEQHGYNDEQHRGMIGLLISPRNKDREWSSSRYPPLDLFPQIIDILAGKVFLTLHIDEKATSNWLDDLLYMISTFGNGDNIDGIQCNVMHPRPADLKNLKATGKKIILQYSTDFLSKQPSLAMKEFEPYVPFCDYALIDPSRGRGIEINLADAIIHYNALKSKGINVGFAGGFNPDNIILNMNKLINYTKNSDFSLDVESGVRTNEVLDLNKVNSFLERVKKVLIDNN